VRLRHFEALRPVCPVCQAQGEAAPLGLATVARREGDCVLEGVLHCARTACRREYPILDGVPVLIADLRSFAANQFQALMLRDDLSATLESLLGDACGPGSAFDVQRQHLSCYARDHYGDFDPEESGSEPPPGAVPRLLRRGLELAPPRPAGPVLDVGCSVGRTTFALAETTDELVLGVDLNFAMLRLAQGVLRRGVVRYPRRRVGVVYDRREFAVDLPHRERVDFWACDALALPFAAEGFGLAVSLNLLDCVASPRDLLAGVAVLLRPGAPLVLSTPYDWAPGATAMEAWLGGHSQRGPDGGAGEPVLRSLLTPGAHPLAVPGVRILAEVADCPWQVRLHDRSTVHYQAHLLVAEKQSQGSG
jgi:SAM-dependent methyltransferase/uncharacterized protein YbaR (Trm112 family)